MTDPNFMNNSANAEIAVTGGSAAFSFSVGNLIRVGPYSPSLYFPGARFVQDVTITNNGIADANAPLQLVLDALPATVRLTNASCTLPDGTPFINLPGALAVGQSVTVRLQFGLSGREEPTFTARVVSGAPNG